MPPEEDRATAIGNMQKNFVKIGHVIPKIWLWTDKHTDTHTETDRQTCSSQYFAPPIGGGVTMNLDDRQTDDMQHLSVEPAFIRPRRFFLSLLLLHQFFVFRRLHLVSFLQNLWAYLFVFVTFPTKIHKLMCFIYKGWQWHNFVSYRCHLVFATILWQKKLWEMFVTLISLEYALLVS